MLYRVLHATPGIFLTLFPEILKNKKMNKKVKKLFALLTTMLMLASCYYDKADLLYPPTNQVTVCDTATATSYAQKVVPLLQQYCYGCHSGGSPSGGIQMGTYNTDKAIALSGSLIGTISYANGYSPMPSGAPKFTDCQIAIIQQWINASSPNN